MLTDTDWVVAKLDWMKREGVWPNGPRYLWTDAFGLVLLASLHRHTGEMKYLEQARQLVEAVEHTLGCARGLKIGETPDNHGQYFHYLAMWLFALSTLARIDPSYRARGVKLAKEIHPAFLEPHVGMWRKMTDDLGRNCSGHGFGVMDAFHGCAAYRCLDAAALQAEIQDLRELVDGTYRDLLITQDLELGVMLWLTHLFPKDPWAPVQRERSLTLLERMWIEPEGYFCWQQQLPQTKFAFTNFGVSLGLQAVGVHPDRVKRLNAYFEHYQSDDQYDRDAITHVLACTSRFPGFFLRPFAD